MNEAYHKQWLKSLEIGISHIQTASREVVLVASGCIFYLHKFLETDYTFIKGASAIAFIVAIVFSILRMQYSGSTYILQSEWMERNSMNQVEECLRIQEELDLHERIRDALGHTSTLGFIAGWVLIASLLVH